MSLLALPVLLLPSLGCGPRYQVAPVSGQVLMDNRPLAQAEVRFYPANPPKGAAVVYSHGQTDQQGNFTLKTFLGDREVDGGLVGEDRVMITLNERDLDRAGGPRGRPRELVPAQYNTNSKLTFTVPPEGSKDANFKLTSK
jgi:hypothetical protein